MGYTVRYTSRVVTPRSPSKRSPRKPISARAPEGAGKPASVRAPELAQRQRIGPSASGLTHLDQRGHTRMVDVSRKASTARLAVASALVRMQPATLRALLSGDTPKGDVLAVARVAGIQAAKRTWELIPMCHQVQLTSVKVELSPRGDDAIAIEVTASAADRTGVEMEALTAASVCALTLYDMLKAIDRGMVIEQIALLEKRGGKSGVYKRK